MFAAGKAKHLVTRKGGEAIFLIHLSTFLLCSFPFLILHRALICFPSCFLLRFFFFLLEKLFLTHTKSSLPVLPLLFSRRAAGRGVLPRFLEVMHMALLHHLVPFHSRHVVRTQSINLTSLSLPLASHLSKRTLPWALVEWMLQTLLYWTSYKKVYGKRLLLIYDLTTL